MKCPKCGYLGFEHVDQCRNCGYDFSLFESVGLADLAIRTGPEDERPLGDLSLLDAATDRVAAAPRANPGTGLDRLLGVKEPAASSELPLFGSSVHEDDRPLITRVAPPRTPLAVRRSTPEVQRRRIDVPKMPTLDLGLDPEQVKALEPAAPGHKGGHEAGHEARSAPSAAVEEDAAVVSRFVAVAIDLLVLGLVDALVVYFTMKICGLGMAEINVLPWGPLIAFLVVQNGGYLVAFTAGGQTLGKMVVGIKVISAGPPASLDLGRALLREALWLVLAVPAGLGFLTILAHDHRGLHDRFAGTRVVR